MSKLFHTDKPVIGLDISPTSIKLMSIDTKRWSVLGYASIDTDPHDINDSLEGDGAYIASSINELLQHKVVGNLGSRDVIMSVPTSRTYARSVMIPKSAKGRLDDAINIEAEQYIPIPLAQLYLDYEITHEDKESRTLLMCAVPRKIVNNCVNAAAQSGLEVLVVEPSIIAVARLLKYTERGDLPTVIVDIGAASTDIAVINGTLKVAGSLLLGGNDFTQAIADRLKISLDAAYQLKVINGLSRSPKQRLIKTALEPSLEKISHEIKKIIRYYNERIPGALTIEQVIVVGGGADVPGIGDFFTENLVIASRATNPWQMLNFDKLPQPARQFKPRYITVAGLASVKNNEVWA